MAKTGEVTQQVNEKWATRFQHQMARCDAYGDNIRELKAMLARSQAELLKEKGKMDGLAQIFIEENMPEVDLAQMDEVNYTFDDHANTFTLQVPEPNPRAVGDPVPLTIVKGG